MEMQVVILLYNGLEVPTRQILDSKGAIPTKTSADAKVAIQEMAVNKKVYVAHVGCEQCKGPHYTKDCPLKEEGKTLKEAYYTQFGVAFQQGGKYKAAALGFYQRNNANSSYQERRQSKEESLSLNDALPQKEKDPGSFTLPCYINNVCFENALAHLGASISVMPLSTYLNLGLGELAHTKLTVELADRTVNHPKGIAKNVLVGIGKFIFLVDFIILYTPEDVKVPLIIERPFLSTAYAKIDVFKRKITLRVGDEKIIFKSVKPASSLIKRVYMLNLKERMELDLEARLMGETLILNRLLNPLYGDYIELNDINAPLELRRDQVDDLMPTIEEDMDPYLDEGIGEVVVGEPLCEVSCRKTKRFDGIITIHDKDDSVTYQMVRLNPTFKHLTNEQCNKIPPLLKNSSYLGLRKKSRLSLKNDMPPRDKMDNPNVTMEVYIRLEEEKARRHGKNLSRSLGSITYGKIRVDNDFYDLKSVDTKFPAIAFDDTFTSEAALSYDPTVSSLNNNEIDFRILFDESDDEDCTNEFPAIVYNGALTSKSDFLTEPTLSPQHIDEFDLEDETSLSEYDEEEQNILYFNDLFSFNVFYLDDLKSNKDNDDNEIDITQSSRGNVNTQGSKMLLKNEFPAIVYNGALTSKSDFLTEPTLSPQHIDEFDLEDETSLSEYDEEEQNILYFNDLFSFNVFYLDDLKSNKDNDDNEIDITQSSRGNVNTQGSKMLLKLWLVHLEIRGTSTL
nr:hypothetical protein [Tanacetum cinerariifolium]